MKMIMQNFYEQKWGLSNMYDHWSLSSLGVTFVNPTLPDRLATDSGARGPGWGVGGWGAWGEGGHVLLMFALIANNP